MDTPSSASWLPMQGRLTAAMRQRQNRAAMAGGSNKKRRARSRRAGERRPGARRSSPAGRPDRLTPVGAAGSALDIPPVNVLAQSILAGGREIVAERDALQVEAWASMMIGTFYKPPVPFEVSERLTAELWPALVRGAERQADRAALAVLLALAAVADDELRRLAQAAAESLRAAGVPDPPWAAIIGHPEFLGCWTAVDPFDDQCGYYLHFRYRGHGQHVVMALRDENLGGIIKDASFGELRTGSDPRKHAESQPDVVVSDADPGVVAQQIAQALATGDMFIDNAWTHDFRDARGLLAARLRCLPAPAKSAEPAEREPEPEPLGEDERVALADEFLDSPQAPACHQAAAITMHCIDSRCDYGDGDPLRWSPAVVELFLLDFVPRKVVLEPDEIEAVPDVLRAWVRFALGKRGLAEHLIAETEEAVREFTPDYREAVADPANFGPAKAMLGALHAAGVDIEDKSAVDAWIAEWNARPQHERDETLGFTLPPGGPGPGA